MKNPSYPARVHLGELPALQEKVKFWDGRIDAARSDLAQRPDDARLRRLFAQMLGARDQLVEGVRRVPQEVGDLYAEDHHRLEAATAALERTFALWENPR